MIDWQRLARIRQDIIRMLERRVDRLEAELRHCTCKDGDK